jgi:type IV secretion system protein VirB6
MALLSVVASMVLDLTIAVNEAIWGAKIANKLLGTDAEGLSTLALQQGGIGLLLTTLIISVPPMAAMSFQGTLGSFSPYSVYNVKSGITLLDAEQKAMQGCHDNHCRVFYSGCSPPESY